MARKLLNAGGKRKLAVKRTVADGAVVLVGTYKEGQLAWIKRHGVYN